jgi:hypothetical protein
MVVVDESVLRHAHITKTTTNKTKTTNNNCGDTRGNLKRLEGYTMSEVSQPPAGPRIRAA